MKTKDFICKKRQELSRKIDILKKREIELYHCKSLALTPEDKDEIAAKISFCKTYIKKAQEEIHKLSGRSKLQILSGWR